MYFDRQRSKYWAKERIRQGVPSPILVTLVYLLLTHVLSTVVTQVGGDPFTRAAPYLAQGYDPHMVYQHVLGGGNYTLAVFLVILMSLFTTVVDFGYTGYTLRLSRSQRGGYGDLIEGFAMAMKVIALHLLMGLFVFLWSMLFVLPGIVATYSYSQAVYCLLDDPDIGPLEAIRRSKEMMRGEKLNFFVLELTFLGWALLVSVAVGLVGGVLSAFHPTVGYWTAEVVFLAGMLWVLPYMQIVFSDFYNYVSGWCPDQPPLDAPEGGEVRF